MTLYRDVVIPSLSSIQLFVTPWTAACQASLPFTISQSLLKLTFTELVMPSNHLILCRQGRDKSRILEPEVEVGLNQEILPAISFQLCMKDI